MARRVTITWFELIFFLALALNGYLLFSAADGARVVRQVELSAGRNLSCQELYQARSVNTYFEPQRHLQGEALYLLIAFWPIWFVSSIIITFGLAAVLDRRRRWLPVLSMGLLVLGLVLYSPVITKIVCAIE